jgi:hypothetical protein
VRGVMELDLTYGGASIGKKGQRNSCAAIALAVDAESGMVLAPKVTDSSLPAGDTLAKVFLKAIQPNQTLPPGKSECANKSSKTVSIRSWSPLASLFAWSRGSRYQTKSGLTCSASFVGILVADKVQPPRSEPHKSWASTRKPPGKGCRESAAASIFSVPFCPETKMIAGRHGSILRGG